MIRINDLKKTFVKDGNNIEVLKGLNLEIRKGESLAMLGVSGAGKSTLIHILGALDHPTSGTVLFDDINIFSWDDNKIAKFRNKKIGFVFQLHNLLPEFSALENTMMPALIQGIGREEAGKKAQRILEELGLGDRLPHKPGELSGGEQQRVAVARALMLDPRIILADEPTGNLDTKTGEEVHNRLVQINRDLGITIVVVTHNPALASRMTRRVLLVDGKLFENT